MTQPSPPPNAASLTEAGEWIQRADQDLQGARGVLHLTRPLPAIAVYHAQQAGEKALKAYLTAHNTPFPLTHNLELLLSRGEVLDPALSELHGEARLLTPYATEFRYPVGAGAPFEPPLTEAWQAIEAGERILARVRQLLGI